MGGVAPGTPTGQIGTCRSFGPRSGQEASPSFSEPVARFVRRQAQTKRVRGPAQPRTTACRRLLFSPPSRPSKSHTMRANAFTPTAHIITKKAPLSFRRSESVGLVKKTEPSSRHPKPDVQHLKQCPFPLYPNTIALTNRISG